MVKSKKQQLTFLLILVCSSARVFGFDPNEIKIEFQFEENSEKQSWSIDRSGKRQLGRGPIRPTHVAILFIQRSHYDLPTSADDARRTVLKTSTAQSISKRQREFAIASDFFAWLGIGKKIQNHDEIRLYAVSEDDAKKIAQAYLEVPINYIRKHYQEKQTELEEHEKMAAQYKSKISKKETELEAAEAKYQKIKSTTHRSSLHSEAAKEATATILEMNKILNSLNIELASIRAKLRAIQRYKVKDEISFAEKLLPVIEQIEIEQTIELAGAKAKKESAIEISSREQDFLDLFRQWATLDHEVKTLRNDLNNRERQIQDDKDRFAEAPWLEEIPKIYQEKVTIYPVAS